MPRALGCQCVSVCARERVSVAGASVAGMDASAPIHKLTDDLLLRIFCSPVLSPHLDVQLVAAQPSAAAQSFHALLLHLSLTCKRWHTLSSTPLCPLWRTVIVSSPALGPSLSKRSVDGPAATPQTAGGGPATPHTGNHSLGASPTWSSWHIARASLDNVHGCSPRSGTASTQQRSSLSVPILRHDRVLEWVAAKARHCQVLYLDISRNHDFTARSVQQLLGLLRPSLRVLFLADSPGQGRQEGYEVLSTLKSLQHLHIQGIPQDFLHLTMPYLSMLPALQTLHFKPDLASYPSPARLTTLPSSLQRLELVKVWIEHLPPPYNRPPKHPVDLAATTAQSAGVPIASSSLPGVAATTLLLPDVTAVSQRSVSDVGPLAPATPPGSGSNLVQLASSPTQQQQLMSPVRPGGSPAVPSLPSYPLRVVRLTECQVTPSALVCLASSPALAELHLVKCTPACTPAAVAAWTPMDERSASFGALALPFPSALQALTLAACRITRLSHTMVEALTGLHSLDLSHNEELGLDSSALPPEIAHLTHLTRLDLKGCGLVSLPPPVAALPSLRHLNLELNALTMLPRQFACESTLEVANISSNRLTCLPPCLYAMTQLRQLVVSSGPVAGTADFHTLHLQLPRLSLLQVKGQTYDCRAVRNLMQLSSCVQRSGSHLHIDVEVP